ncbi:MAG: hypothetical protein Q9O24_03885 [Gammaproteobacteria bacterium]|nr:hypothetical protein [Gammaproteobacteria bacterium]
MQDILYQRIKRGVVNFFESLRLAFSNQQLKLHTINTIQIFLAGNSSKSPWVTELFEIEMMRVSAEMQEKGIEIDDFFTLHPCLSSDQLDKPNGKTGVAYGLIETSPDGVILVIDHNVKEEIAFKYYLGQETKKNSESILDRQDAYHQWVEFIDASQTNFKLFYSSTSTVSTNNVRTSDPSIQLRRLRIEQTHENAHVYLRPISPSEIEYVVAHRNDIENQTYLSEIKKVSL